MAAFLELKTQTEDKIVEKKFKFNFENIDP